MAEKKPVGVGAAIGIAVVALAVVGFFGYRTLSGPSYPTVPTAKELHSTEEQLALKSGGDFSKLSASEQKQLNDMTLGHGKKFVELNYQRLSASGGK